MQKEFLFLSLVPPPPERKPVIDAGALLQRVRDGRALRDALRAWRELLMKRHGFRGIGETERRHGRVLKPYAWLLDQNPDIAQMHAEMLWRTEGVEV